MSNDVLSLLKNMKQDELSTQVALQCSPVITKVKISNLLIIKKEDRDEAIKMFRQTPLSYYKLYESDKKITFLIYNKRELLEYINRSDVIAMFSLFGYATMDLKSILKELSVRYRMYMNTKSHFPHEMGLLLGYPVCDVAGFMENEGKNYKYTGYWKVYGDINQAKHCFALFNQAKELVITMLSKGMGVNHIIDIYYS